MSVIYANLAIWQSSSRCLYRRRSFSQGL